MKELELAYYIVNNYHNFELNKEGITHLKLQKLLYYVKGWSTVAKVDVGNIEFLAWKHGPVNTIVYEQFKSFKKDPITPSPSFKIKPDNEKKTLIDFIVKNYILFDAVTLSSMTHKEMPWKMTPQNEVISESLMEEYYSKQNFAKNFPLSDSKKFYPVKTDLDYSFELDMEMPEELPELSYYSLQNYLTEVKKSQKKLENSLNNLLNDTQ